MQNSAKFWDKAAAKYAKSTIEDMDAYTYTLERTKSYLSSTDKVLEIGCGTGSTALLLAENVEQLTASDLSGAMIKIGSDKASDQGITNVKFVTAGVFDAVLEPAGDEGLYDTILAFNVLHLVKDTPVVMQRINGLLKPGGLFISKTICKPEAGAPFKFRLMMMILPLMQIIGKAPYVKITRIKAFEGLISSNGFDIIETGNYPASPPSRYIVARKIQTQ